MLYRSIRVNIIIILLLVIYNINLIKFNISIIAFINLNIIITGIKDISLIVRLCN